MLVDWSEGSVELLVAEDDVFVLEAMDCCDSVFVTKVVTVDPPGSVDTMAEVTCEGV